MIYLFTTPSCPNCPGAKRFLQENKLAYTLVDASQKEGLALAQKYEFSSVPSLLMTDQEGKQKLSLSGLDDIMACHELLCSSPDSKD